MKARVGVLLALLAAVSAAPIGVLSAGARSGPLGISFLRAATAAPLFWAAARLSRAPALQLRDILGAVALGALGVPCLFASYQLALRVAGVSLGTALAESAPVFVVLFSPLILRERLTHRRVIGALIAAVGVALACTPLHAVSIGAITAGLMASVTYAGFYLASGAILAHAPPTRVMAVAMSAATVVLAPFASEISASESLLPIFGLGAVSTFVAYLAKAESIARIGAARGAAFSSLEPALAIGLSTWLVHEPRGPLFLPGAFVELVGIWLVVGESSNAQQPHYPTWRRSQSAVLASHPERTQHGTPLVEWPAVGQRDFSKLNPH
jgi:drug/metabolite transporter (DMT)-like permease